MRLAARYPGPDRGSNHSLHEQDERRGNRNGGSHDQSGHDCEQAKKCDDQDAQETHAFKTRGNLESCNRRNAIWNDAGKFHPLTDVSFGSN